jgi:hypothetical protein
MNVTLAQYRRLRAIYLRTARAYRFGSVWGPADREALRVEQGRLAALRASLA